jgi:phosphatidylglycerol---prolipoprotein diacylglyceryl transferase
MIDFHLHPEGGGVYPLIKIGSLQFSSYALFMALAILTGIILYRREARKHKFSGDKAFYVIMGALIGGVLGAKIPIWIMNFPTIISSFPDIGPILSGRTITGGLVGGTLGVLYVKRKLKIKGRKGNLFAPAIALGMAIGRIGCFLAGCCYGKATSLPWGVNFGDGILRHPTQIYEFIFMIGLFIYLQWKKGKNPGDGQLFTILMVSYFIFRFFIEFIRAEPIIFLGLTFFQYVSIAVVIWFFIKEKHILK